MVGDWWRLGLRLLLINPWLRFMVGFVWPAPLFHQRDMMVTTKQALETLMIAPGKLMWRLSCNLSGNFYGIQKKPGKSLAVFQLVAGSTGSNDCSDGLFFGITGAELCAAHYDLSGSSRGLAGDVLFGSVFILWELGTGGRSSDGRAEIFMFFTSSDGYSLSKPVVYHHILYENRCFWGDTIFSDKPIPSGWLIQFFFRPMINGCK